MVGARADGAARHAVSLSLNGDTADPDPYSRSQPEGVHGPSEVVDPEAFDWHDAGWPGSGIDGLVDLPVHVGTATPDGTFDSLIASCRGSRRSA